MGCCILAAMIIGRWITAFERLRRIIRRLWILDFGVRVELGGPARPASRGFASSRPLFLTMLFVELSLLGVVIFFDDALASLHIGHVLSVMTLGSDPASFSDFAATVCATPDHP
jgi:hypothetical protein